MQRHADLPGNQTCNAALSSVTLTIMFYACAGPMPGSCNVISCDTVCCCVVSTRLWVSSKLFAFFTVAAHMHTAVVQTGRNH